MLIEKLEHQPHSWSNLRKEIQDGETKIEDIWEEISHPGDISWSRSVV